MIHSVHHVAVNNFFDPDKFQKFALEYKYGCYIMSGGVSTWNVDELKAAYREFRGAEFMAERESNIRKHYPERAHV